MKKDPVILLDHILESIMLIENYASGVSEEEPLVIGPVRQRGGFRTS